MTSKGPTPPPFTTNVCCSVALLGLKVSTAGVNVQDGVVVVLLAAEAAAHAGVTVRVVPAGGREDKRSVSGGEGLAR